MDIKDLFETIIEERISDKSDVLSALQVTEEFIRRKGLVLYGGIAIDYAIKLAQDDIGIYRGTTLPDYDVRSPNPYEDSIELAQILHEMGFMAAQSINAIHVTTRKVRINFIPVADISFIPDIISLHVPTITYNGLLATHPDFQRCDIHSSLAFPYDNPPNEVVLHRLSKDTSRLMLINKFYPITKPNQPSFRQFTAKITGILTGVPAFCYYWSMFNDQAYREDGKSISFLSHSGQTSYCIVDSLESPPLGYKLYEPFMELRPTSARANNVEILYYTGRSIAYNVTPAGNKVVNIQLLMLYFISRHFECKVYGLTDEAIVSLYYYCVLFDMFQSFEVPSNIVGISESYSHKANRLKYYSDVGIEVTLLDKTAPNVYFSDAIPTFDYNAYFYKMSGREVDAIVFDKIRQSNIYQAPPKEVPKIGSSEKSNDNPYKDLE